MRTTGRILTASVVALALPWVTISAAEARPKFDLTQFERCLAAPSLKDSYGVRESSFAKRQRCCASAGGVLVISTQGPPNCVQPGAEGPRAVIDMPSVSVLTPA
ncbi:hypothetical protein BST22_02915 [Mycolicibacterium chubuense]|uniref:Uncharacterized protein n=1 Tax=Mycolicibacterium chubuense TaxID=1800 RepID=A0A0J6WIS7_MYCCU|nr:hypothetical protein [Mycolicibacterium chubuense]KMO81617.1 hypothetical protein MCHUDSM44219_01971 [Mycolicibacterium chubuense]ORA55504.1 hypothetical protein BST22_02915 [Mycolicibacterium chubuense]SPX95844.1 Uncharacterised protein [Mycolicibacterium chubuense]